MSRSPRIGIIKTRVLNSKSNSGGIIKFIIKPITTVFLSNPTYHSKQTEKKYTNCMLKNKNILLNYDIKII